MPDAAREALEMIKRRATEAGGNVYGDLAEAALTQSPPPREGEWVMVPREPSVEQLNAARDWSLRVNGQGVGNAQATGCYQAMLAAAPPSPDMENRGDEPSSDASVSASPAADVVLLLRKAEWYVAAYHQDTRDAQAAETLASIRDALYRSAPK